MKKVISIILILAMIFSFASCGQSKTINSDSIVLKYNNCDIEADKLVRINTSLRIVPAYDGKDNESYNVYCYTGDVYHLCGSYSLGVLKEGIDIGVDYTLAKNSDFEVCFVVSQQDANKIADIEQYSKNLADQWTLTYCEEPVELEKKIAAKVSDYDDLIRTYQLQWHEYPVTEDDHVDNICYCLVTGNFEWTYDATGILTLPEIKSLRVDVAGHIINQDHFFCFRDGKYYVGLNRMATSPLTPSDISEQNVEAYIAARKIYDELHSTGKITDQMTEKQIAEVYSDYLQAYGVGIYDFNNGDINHPDNNDNPNVSIQYMVLDTAYSCLVNKVGSCASKAAAYNILMNMEGIYAIGLGVMGHIVSYMKLDGDEYYCDWGNRIGLFIEEDVNSNRVNIQWRVNSGDWLGVVREYYEEHKQ